MESINDPQCGVRIGGGEWKRDGRHTEARAQQENLGTGDRHDDNWEDIRVLDWENRKKNNIRRGNKVESVLRVVASNPPPV